MTGLVCEFGTPLRDHRQPAQQRSCPVLASLIHRLRRPLRSAPPVGGGCASAPWKSRVERNGPSLPARRAARRRRKPTCCRSNSSKRLSAALASIGGDLSQQRRPQDETAGVEGLIVGHGQEQPKVVARKRPPARWGRR